MSEKLTIEALRRDPAYLALTEQQRALVEAYLECGDRVQATFTAYNCQSRESARVMSYAVFSNPRIVVALAVANGGTDFESFRCEVLAAARNKKLSVAQIRALELYARLSGFVSEPAGSDLIKAPAEEPAAPRPVSEPTKDTAGPKSGRVEYEWN